MKKRISILLGIFLISLVLAPIVYNYFTEKMYYKNHIVAFTTFTEVTIHDKYIKDDNYYLEFTIDSEHYIEKYRMDNKIRIYQVADKELYEQVDLSRSEDYIGLTVESEVDKSKVSIQEIRNFESDPFFIISKQEYSKYIKIVDIHQR